MLTLPPGQQKMLDFIREYRGQHGFSPTIRDIMDHFGMKSPNGVKSQLHALEKKGRITRQEFIARSICVVGESNGKTLLADILDFIGVPGVVDERFTYRRDQLCQRIKKAIFE